MKSAVEKKQESYFFILVTHSKSLQILVFDKEANKNSFGEDSSCRSKLHVPQYLVTLSLKWFTRLNSFHLNFHFSGAVVCICFLFQSWFYFVFSCDERCVFDIVQFNTSINLIVNDLKPVEISSPKTSTIGQFFKSNIQFPGCWNLGDQDPRNLYTLYFRRRKARVSMLYIIILLVATTWIFKVN